MNKLEKTKFLLLGFILGGLLVSTAYKVGSTIKVGSCVRELGDFDVAIVTYISSGGQTEVEYSHTDGSVTNRTKHVFRSQEDIVLVKCQ